jgi:hypothetical protein
MAVACFSAASCNLEVFNSGDLHVLFGAFLAHCCPLQTEEKRTISLMVAYCSLVLLAPFHWYFSTSAFTKMRASSAVGLKSPNGSIAAAPTTPPNGSAWTAKLLAN